MSLLGNKSNVPVSLRQRLKLQAVKEAREMSEIMTELLEAYLDKHTQE